MTGHKHARPPLRVVDADPSPELRSRRRRRPRVVLPEDDPFVLLGMVDETGGVTGDKRAMNYKAAAAFRILCLMSPMHRTLARLGAQLELDWGKAPNRKTIETWSSKYSWQKLLKLYDENLDRYRLLKIEQERIEARSRHARIARQMVDTASKALQEEITGLDEDGNEIAASLDSRGRPVRRSSRVQPLAFAINVGIAAERQALGLPSIITDARVEAEVHSTGNSSAMSLEEWRRQSRLARIQQQDEPRLPDSLNAGEEQQKQLPAPSSHAEFSAARVIEDLSADESGDLPESWHEPEDEDQSEPTRVVEGTVVPANS